MPERPEILSTARPSALRLWGFLALATGALVAGWGALSDWATLGFPGDTSGALDVAVKGADVWEGVVVLGAAVASLVALLAMRLVGSPSARRGIAFGVATLGALVVAIALSVAIRADARFGGAEGLDDVAADLAARLEEPVGAVRAQLEERFSSQVRVDLGVGVWLALAGGALIDLGGALGLAWARRPAGAADGPPGP